MRTRKTEPESVNESGRATETSFVKESHLKSKTSNDLPRTLVDKIRIEEVETAHGTENMNEATILATSYLHSEA